MCMYLYMYIYIYVYIYIYIYITYVHMHVCIYVHMYTYIGDADQLVPPSHMKRLYESSTSSIYTDFFSVFGGGHNDTFGKFN
jgi:hypothetical protein